MTDFIPEDNDVARYAGFSKIDGKTGRLSGAAFRLKEEEEYLSVYCLNMLLGDNVSSRIEHLKKDIPLETTARGKLGVVNVGVMKKAVESKSEDNRKLTVTHEPHIDSSDTRLNCDYHCGVRGFGYEDEVIADLIAECVTECYPALKKPKSCRL